MAMTDAEFNAWVDKQVDEAVKADLADAIKYMESGELDREVEAAFAEEEARVAELEKNGQDEPADDDSDIEEQ